MRFQHMCVVTTDIDRAVRFQQDPMGFDVAVRMSIPDGDDFGPGVLAPRKLRNRRRSSIGSTSIPTGIWPPAP
jgi:catechol 2,3-dioxygenase-like lactoylglutathione lyase family enzyme